MGNLLYRQAMIRQGMESPEAADAQWEMCRRDPLFWLNVYGWVYEPRHVVNPVVPLITWECQDDVLIEMLNSVGVRDMTVKKSRDMGATWNCLLTFLYRWHFYQMQTFLLVSRTQDMVYKMSDPDALFSKMGFFLEHEPGYIAPRYTMPELRLTNHENGSTVNGASTTGNVSRGGRRTAIMLDEYAAFSVEDGYRALYATQAATNCRIFNSTPQGTGNAYYDIAHDPNMKQIVLHWSQHPEKRKGLYTSHEGVREILDKGYDYPPDYEFVCDGKIRSPWYDGECRRTPVPQLIAQELDMDFLGSGYGFFDRPMLDLHSGMYVRNPYAIGELDYDALTGVPAGFEEDFGEKRLRLWVQLDARGLPPRDRPYVVGGDVAAGTGASNSCLVVGDMRTGEKVAEFATPGMRPDTLAVYAAALGRWFAFGAGEAPRPALVVVEANGGHNRQFLEALSGEALGYGHIYRRRNEASLSRRTQDSLGWGSSRDNKRALLEEWGRALATGDFIERSELALNEAREYVYQANGAVEHARARNVIDPSGSGANHGDRAMASALCWHGMKGYRERPIAEQEPPVGCFEWRMRQHERRRDTLLEASW